jgi:transposase
MIANKASSHRGKDLAVPENTHLLPLPACSPEQNPQEHLCEEIREEELPNRVFDFLDGVKK